MDVRLARLETQQTRINGKDRYVIVIANRDIFENFHFEDQRVFSEWIKELAKHCVLGQLDKYYKSCSLTGTADLTDGAYGDVMVAESREDGDLKVVIKTYRTDIPCPQGTKKKQKKNDPGEMVYDEIRVLRLLNDPSVLRLRGIFEEPGIKIIVTDYLEGGDLYKYMKKNNHVVNWREALEYTKGLLMSLAHLEKNRVVHRDIKMSNLALRFADGSYHIALIDFGFAICLDDFPPGSELPRKFGTVGYYAPEVLAGAEMFDCRADVYSAGVLLFMMLSGEAAFSYTDIYDCIDKNTNGTLNWEAFSPARICQKIPTEVMELLQVMLRHRKKDRPFASKLLSDKAFDLLRKPGVLPHPKGNPKYATVVTLEEDQAFFVTDENEARVSQISKSSFRNVEGDNQ